MHSFLFFFVFSSFFSPAFTYELSVSQVVVHSHLTRIKMNLWIWWKNKALKKTAFEGLYKEQKSPKSMFNYTIYYQKLIDSCWVRFWRKELVSKDAEMCPTTTLATTTTTNKYWTVIRPRVSIEYYAFQMSTNAICLISSHGCDWVVA